MEQILWSFYKFRLASTFICLKAPKQILWPYIVFWSALILVMMRFTQNKYYCHDVGSGLLEVPLVIKKKDKKYIMVVYFGLVYLRFT